MLSLELMCVIYVITHVASGRKYVGYTRYTAPRRYRGHVKAAKAGEDTYIARAIRLYGASAFKIEVLEQCEEALLNEREIFWIQKLGTVKPHGFNLTEGGGGMLRPSESTRQKMRDAHLGKVRGPLSEEHKAAVSRAQKGRPRWTDEQRKEIAARQTGKSCPHNIENCRQLGFSWKGKKFTEEHRVKLREAWIRRRMRGGVSEETRQKLGDASRGRTMSVEARRKISEARKRYFTEKYIAERSSS
jgi:group I intron endonuclease